MSTETAQTPTPRLPQVSLQTSRRAARRRRQRARDEEHLRAMEFAQELYLLADRAPDMEAASDLYGVVNAIRLRYARDEHKQRLAVLRALEDNALVTARQVAVITRLQLSLVQAILDDFCDDRKGLAEPTTLGGHQNSGRGGTVIYYRLHRKGTPPEK